MNPTDIPTPALAPEAPAPQPKRPYEAPRLVELGDVAELTQGGGFTISDFLTTKRKGP